jgi:phosphatidylinositol phospholipase C delta
VKILRRRPELEGIYEKLSTANGGKFDLAGFIKFMKEYQKANFIALCISS